MRYWLSFLVVVLVACGGYVAAPEVAPIVPPVVIAPAPAASEPGKPAAVVPPVELVQPAPEPPAPPASAPLTPTFTELWREDWLAPVMGGYVIQPIINCAGSINDPQTAETFSQFANSDSWATFGDRAQIRSDIASATGGALVLDSAQDAARGGWAILSAARFEPSVQMVLEGTIELQPDQGAWISMPLIAGEGDYRQISLREDNGQITADMGAPCYYKRLATYPPGPLHLKLGWHPITGWTYSVDGVLLHSEPVDHANADLAGPVRIGIYVVNVGVESRRQASGRVRANVGPLRLLTP